MKWVRVYTKNMPEGTSGEKPTIDYDYAHSQDLVDAFPDFKGKMEEKLKVTEDAQAEVVDLPFFSVVTDKAKLALEGKREGFIKVDADQLRKVFEHTAAHGYTESDRKVLKPLTQQIGTVLTFSATLISTLLISPEKFFTLVNAEKKRRNIVEAERFLEQIETILSSALEDESLRENIFSQISLMRIIENVPGESIKMADLLHQLIDTFLSIESAQDTKKIDTLRSLYEKWIPLEERLSEEQMF